MYELILVNTCVFVSAIIAYIYIFDQSTDRGSWKTA